MSSNDLFGALGGDDFDAAARRRARLEAERSLLAAAEAPQGPEPEPVPAGLARAAAARRGGAADDRMVGDGTAEVIVGGGGDDTILGRAGADLLRGGPGDDALFAAAGRDTMIGGAGDDSLRGGAQAERLIGAGGDDTINGGGGDDLIRGGGGNDLLLAAAGRNTLIGGAGNDLIKGGRQAERLIGNAGDDTMNGGGGNDFMKGGGGDDVMRGAGGDDTLIGGAGNDRILGNAGDDLARGNNGADSAKMGAGDDKAIGMAGNDTIDGQAGDDLINGGGGGDVLRGGKGDDTLIGGPGDDLFVFTNADLRRPSFDMIRGFRPGQDKIDLRGVSGIDDFGDVVRTAVNGGVELEIGRSTIFLKGVARGQISANDFIFTGDASTLDPNTGGPGNDALEGTAGDDLIQGLGGNDTLAAGAGSDTLIGGGGSDIFVVRLLNGGPDPKVDVVKDFTYAAGDKVGLTEILSGIVFDSLLDVARATPTGGDTMIAVNRGAGFQNVLRLEGVSFTTEQLLSYGFTAPPRNSAAFVENPYGFANNSFATADPDATRDGRHVVWVDKQNLDNDPLDTDPATNENGATRDVFIMNTETGAIERVSERIFGEGFNEAASPALSSDGRFVAYVYGSRNAGGDVFVRDMAFPDRAPVQVNIDADGAVGPVGTPISNVNRGGLSGSVSTESVSVLDISGNGDRVVFATRADLTGSSGTDTNLQLDVYLRDIAAGTTTLISGLNGVAQGVSGVYPSGFAGAGDIVRITENGRFVAFLSTAAFVSGDNDGDQDLYLFDTVSKKFLLVSTSKDGFVSSFDITPDGKRVAFATNEAINGGDANGPTDAFDISTGSDIYVADIDLSGFRVTSRDRLSEAAGGFETKDGRHFAPNISPDGSKVAFLTTSQDFFDFNDGPPSSNGFSNERLVVMNVDGRQVFTPDGQNAVANRDSVTTHAALTDDGIVFRNFNDNEAPNSRRPFSDTIAQTDLVRVTEPADNEQREIFRFSSLRGEISSTSDTDVFRYRDTGDSKEVRIIVEGVDSNGGTLANPSLIVRSGSPTGSVFASDNDSGPGRDAQVIVDPNAFATLFIEVDGVGSSTGSYRLTIDTLF